MKRDKLDTVISQLARERANWRCEYDDCSFCRNQCFRNHKGGLHCSHFKGRRNRSTRWFPDNVFALCMKRHEYMGDNPDEHAAWVRSKLGDSRFDDLVLRGNRCRKYTRNDREEMYQHFKAQVKYLERRRSEGEHDYLDVVSWD